MQKMVTKRSYISQVSVNKKVTGKSLDPFVECPRTWATDFYAEILAGCSDIAVFANVVLVQETVLDQLNVNGGCVN